MKMKKIITTMLTAILFIIIGLFIFRSCMSTDHSIFSSPSPTEALCSAYSDGDSAIFTHKQTTEISEDGYFAAYNMFYNPESGELQLTVRWNDSTYRYTGYDEGEDFTFVLVNETTGEEYPCRVIESKKRLIYNYRRMAADGVSLGSDEQLSVKLVLSDIYSSPQIVKYGFQPLTEYKLPRSLKKELIP